MAPLNALEDVAGFLLIFFVPGYAVTKALFPEWRIRGPERYLRLLEIVSLGFVLSLVLTILVGYLLLVGTPAGFQSYWSAPTLEAALTAIAGVAIVVGLLRGAYARSPPAARGPPAVEPDEAEVWAVTRELDRLGREERHLVRALNRKGLDPAEEGRLRSRLSDIRARADEIGRRREAEIAD